jgi:hypothetical protein
MLERLPGENRVTVGADKGYDTKDFVTECRNLQVTPHRSIIDTEGCYSRCWV